MNLINPIKNKKYRLSDGRVVTYLGTKTVTDGDKKKNVARVLSEDGNEIQMTMYELKKDIDEALDEGSEGKKNAVATPPANKSPEPPAAKPKEDTPAEVKTPEKKTPPRQDPPKPKADSFAKEMADGFNFWFGWLLPSKNGE